MTKKHIDNLGIDTSLLGYGCMRFPTKDGNIDEVEAEKLLDTAYNSGVNYFDTAYPYHGGQSEPFVGKILDKYPRESYYLATKLPCWLVHSLDDAKKLFESQLERLHKDYIDFYLLHALNKQRFDEMVQFGVIDYLEAEQAAGRIKYLGFSFHAPYEVFEEILNFRKWDFCQIQLNYMDTDEQAGMKGYALSEKLGVPLIIMEPVKGGSLATLPEEITGELKSLKPDASIASWALRWVGSLPNVKVVLSGMTTMDQLTDNLKTFESFEPLNAEEENAVTALAKTIRSRVFNGCTGCAYCVPCPAGVKIPYNFKIWNEYGMYRNKGSVSWTWKNDIDDASKAKNCIKCGKCEEVCPQSIHIRDDLETLQKTLDELCY